VDQTGWNALIGSYLPRLTQFAERHLTPDARGTLAAADVVQEAVMKSIRHLHRFEFRHDEAFLAYLRKSIRHRIVDEIRRAKRRPRLVALGMYESADQGLSPLERVIARSQAKRYRDALASLREHDRRLIVLRVEYGLSYEDIAGHLGLRTESAARMALRRAIDRLGANVNRERRLSSSCCAGPYRRQPSAGTSASRWRQACAREPPAGAAGSRPAGQTIA
jgi:RNA polymerase sigma factor (sigma-70 family)